MPWIKSFLVLLYQNLRTKGAVTKSHSYHLQISGDSRRLRGIRNLKNTGGQQGFLQRTKTI